MSNDYYNKYDKNLGVMGRIEQILQGQTVRFKANSEMRPEEQKEISFDSTVLPRLSRQCWADALSRVSV